MSIRELAAVDDSALYDIDGDEITLVSPDETETYRVSGQYVRRGTDIDPGTGLPIQSDVSAFSASLRKLVEVGLSDPERLKNEKGWTVSGADILGAVITMRVNTALLDRTIGRVTILGKV